MKYINLLVLMYIVVVLGTGSNNVMGIIFYTKGYLQALIILYIVAFIISVFKKKFKSKERKV